MTNITQYKGIVAPLDIINVDTDAIISKQFLKKTTQTGFGKYLFSNWRFLDDKCKIINNDFILNKPYCKHATILLTRENFGCGSSREHAVWALMDYGFKVIISSNFADIFYNNCIQNKLLTIILSPIDINAMFMELSKSQKSEKITVNLEKKIIHTKNKKYQFTIDDSHLHFILNKIDYVNWTLTKYEKKIINYENNQLLTFLK